MQIKNKLTDAVFEVDGSVNKIVHCHSFVNSHGETITVQFEENATANDDYELVVE